MRRKIPSTAALCAFESAARHQSFTKAAEELALTQSAVCRQIAALEAFVRAKLFRRSRRGVVLTEAGQRYSRNVRTRLNELERDTVEFMTRGGEGGSLELAVVPTFATKWLLPRMPAFQRACPGITVHLTPHTRPFLFDDTALDAAVHVGEPGWPGTRSCFLMRETLIAVGSPRLIAPRRRLKPAELANYPLLQASTRPHAWRQWFEALGVTLEHDMSGPRMELFSMLTEAAAQGLGLALVPSFLVEAELASGALVQVVDKPVASDRSYHLIYPERASAGPALSAFRDWLEAEARAYRQVAGLG